MTKRPVFLAALLVLTGSRFASGQSPHSLSLEVTPISAGAIIQNTSGSQAGSTGRSSGTGNTRITSASETLQINVRNFRALPDNAHVEWYFVAAPLHPDAGRPADEQEFVFDQGSKDLSVAGGRTETFTAGSKEVTSIQKSKGRGRSSSKGGFSMGKANQKPTESGSTLRGWLVRVVADGQAVATRGSTQTYEDIGKDETSLQALLDGEPPKDALRKKKPKATGKPAPGKPGAATGQQ